MWARKEVESEFKRLAINRKTETAYKKESRKGEKCECGLLTTRRKGKKKGVERKSMCRNRQRGEAEVHGDSMLEKCASGM